MMSDSDTASEGVPGSKRSKAKLVLNRVLFRGKEGVLKGELQLQQALGLGHKPNVIPPGEASINGELRTVEIGWHPVMGFAGKWFEGTELGKKISGLSKKYPDPTQHWAVLVGEYCHELWMDEHLHVIYINEKINREEWHTFEVGKTRFNDEALRQAGEMVIFNMRQKKPAYNLIDNNCQNFASLMLEAIQIGAHVKFVTSYQVYQAATGEGRIKDLWNEHPEETEEHAVQNAQQLMVEETTEIDNHHSLFGCSPFR
ncbi:hypothetical protein QBC46DRAFT_397831 [Diplogelasinospora grovesii]|uniref:PPPDE domain-containing protein n=1 Tax=Diplogelasinospora grovesii TaxID=303347 RepID=A0AAN6MZ92_9PEZI|nr:hypothetical protein QBC46DRAFT_397831 [Diplogelasinospora grovesii]